MIVSLASLTRVASRKCAFNEEIIFYSDTLGEQKAHKSPGRRKAHGERQSERVSERNIANDKKNSFNGFT